MSSPRLGWNAHPVLPAFFYCVWHRSVHDFCRIQQSLQIFFKLSEKELINYDLLNFVYGIRRIENCFQQKKPNWTYEDCLSELIF